MLSVVVAPGCKKQEESTDGAALAALFAAPDSGAVADAAVEAAAETATDEALPQLKQHRVGTMPLAPVARVDAGAAPAATGAPGNPNAPGCQQARMFCQMNREPMCTNYKNQCTSGGGRL